MKKTVKRSLSVALLLVMALGLLGVSALADAAVVTVASSDSAVVGETVELPVSISGNPGFAAFNLELVYDEDKLELADNGITAGSALADSYFIAKDSYVSFAGADNITGDVVLFTVKFTVKAAGSTEVSVKLGGREGGLFAGADAKDVEVSFAAGTVTAKDLVSGFNVTVDNKAKNGTVSLETGLYSGTQTFTVTNDAACVVLYSVDGGESYTRLDCSTEDGVHSFTVDVQADMTIVVAVKGDVNLDGEFTGIDVTLIRRAAAGSYPLNALKTMVADVNKDGDFSGIDVTLIRRAAAGNKPLAW